jgi:predicted metal-dependent peptidase
MEKTTPVEEIDLSKVEVNKTKLQEVLKMVSIRLMNVWELKLIGALLYSFEIKSVNDPKITAYVWFNGKNPCIVLGEQFLSILNEKQVLFVYLHEILHFINSHHKRGTKYDRVLANLAADHVVNEMLLKDLGQVTMEDGTTTKNVIGKYVIPTDNYFIVKELIGKNYSFEKTYTYLITHAKVMRVECPTCGKSQTKDKGQGQEQKQGQGKGQEEGQEEGQGQGQGEGQGQAQTGQCPNCGGGSPGTAKYRVRIKGEPDRIYQPDIHNGNESDTDVDECSEDLKDAIRGVMEGLKSQSSNNRGFGKGAIVEFIKDLIKIKIPWTELLELAIKSHVIQSFENKAWKNPLKRMRAHGFTLPGNGTETTASTLLIGIDTSGSVGSEDLTKFLSICKDSLIHFDKLVVIQHDYVIQKITEVQKDNMETGLDDIAHFKGRGGTSHKEFFDYTENELWHNNEDIGLCILLTDYYSDVEELWTSGKYNWVTEYPIKVVLNHANIQMVSAFIDEHPIVIEEDIH